MERETELWMDSVLALCVVLWSTSYCRNDSDGDMPALNLDSILLRSWWTETPLNCAGTLQMDTWKSNKRKGCELPWQHCSRKWPGVCILADSIHNRSTRGALHQSCFSKRRGRSTLTDPVCKEAERRQRGTLRSPRGWGQERGGKDEQRAEHTSQRKVQVIS